MREEYLNFRSFFRHTFQHNVFAYTSLSYTGHEKVDFNKEPNVSEGWNSNRLKPLVKYIFKNSINGLNCGLKIFERRTSSITNMKYVYRDLFDKYF